MSKLMRFIYFWGPVLLWMAIIFFFSSRERLAVSDEFTLNFLFFKTLHVIEYGVLFFFSYRATYNLEKNKRMALVYATCITLLYAITDEIHQTFVPSREGTFRDVFIDTVGIVIMYMYIKKSEFMKQFI